MHTRPFLCICFLACVAAQSSTVTSTSTATGTPVQYQSATGTPVQYQSVTGTPVQYQSVTGTPVQYQSATGTPAVTPPPALANVLKHVLSILASSSLTQSVFNQTAASLSVAFGELLNVDPATVTLLYMGGVHRRLLASSGSITANVTYSTYDEARQAAMGVSTSALAAAVRRAGSPQLGLVSVAVDGEEVQTYDPELASPPRGEYYYVSVYWLGGMTTIVVVVLVCLLCFRNQILSCLGWRKEAPPEPKSEVVIPCGAFEPVSGAPAYPFASPPSKPLPDLPDGHCAAV